MKLIKRITSIASVLTVSAAIIGCGVQKETTSKKTESKMEEKMSMKESTINTVVKTGVLSGTGKEKSEGNVEIKNGKVILTNFKTAKGPDLHIYLTKGKDVKTGKKLGAVNLNKSEQTFNLGDIDIMEYDSVIIYCDKAHVTFGSADLKS